MDTTINLSLVIESFWPTVGRIIGIAIVSVLFGAPVLGAILYILMPPPR